MSTRAAEAIVKIEMAKSGIEIVGVKTADDVSAHPDAFGIAGRTGQLLGDFDKLVDARRIFLLIALLLLLLGLVGLIRIVLRHDGAGRECRGKAESWKSVGKAERHDGG